MATCPSQRVLEVSKRHSPTRARYVAKPYPRDNEPRTFAVRQDWLDAVAAHMKTKDMGRDDLLFTTNARHPDFPEHLPDPRLAARRRGERRGLQRPHARLAPCSRVVASCRRRPHDRDGPPRPRPDPDDPQVPARAEGCGSAQLGRARPNDAKPLQLGQVAGPMTPETRSSSRTSIHIPSPNWISYKSRSRSGRLASSRRFIAK